jgi:hypothetical protein
VSHANRPISGRGAGGQVRWRLHGAVHAQHDLVAGHEPRGLVRQIQHSRHRSQCIGAAGAGAVKRRGIAGERSLGQPGAQEARGRVGPLGGVIVLDEVRRVPRVAAADLAAAAGRAVAHGQLVEVAAPGQHACDHRHARQQPRFRMPGHVLVPTLVLGREPEWIGDDPEAPVELGAPSGVEAAERAPFGRIYEPVQVGPAAALVFGHAVERLPERALGRSAVACRVMRVAHEQRAPRAVGRERREGHGGGHGLRSAIVLRQQPHQRPRRSELAGRPGEEPPQRLDGVPPRIDHLTYLHGRRRRGRGIEAQAEAADDLVAVLAAETPSQRRAGA